jgi:hypothetical protein
MKKVSCLVLALSAVVYTASAQFYVNAGIGYAIPQAGQTFDGSGGQQGYNGTHTFSTYTDVFSVKPASFTAGVHGALGIGYMLSDHVGIQLDGNVGLSTKKYTFTLDNVQVSGVLSNVNIVQQAKSPFFLIPALVLQTGGEKLNLYTRFGAALPINTKIIQDQVVTNVPGTGATEVDDFTLKIKNSFSLGISAAVGVKYKLNDKVSLCGEISLLSMSAYIKESDLTSVTVNGSSYPLSQVSGPQTIKYSKNVTVDSNGAQQPTYSQPFSNVGINVGVSFNIGEKRQRGANHFNSDEGDDNKKPFRRR